MVNSAFTVNDNVNLNASSAGGYQRSAGCSNVNVNDCSSLIVNNSGTVTANVNVGPSALLGLFGRVNGNIVNAGFFQGTGFVNGNVFNSGIVSPGPRSELSRSTATTRKTRAVLLRIEVAGASPGQFDVLAVNGRASLAGTLQLVRVGNFDSGRRSASRS